MNADLRGFVREALVRGHSRDAIRAALGEARWRADEIEAALAEWADSPFAMPVPRRKSQLSAREAFLYLVMFATLYVAAFNTGAILFLLIERWLPDAAAAPWTGDPRLDGLRWAVAGLLIALPVFLYTQRLIAAALAREPEQRVSGVRRWLTYLTLFVAALILIGDFVVVLRGLLSGELVPRFLLKAAVVASIAGIVFRHYLADLRRDESETPSPSRPRPWLARLGVAGMVVTAALALIVIGTPRKARYEQLDTRRVGDLQQLSAAIDRYHERYGRLPGDLDALRAQPETPDFARTRDPETGQSYVYQVIGERRYRLCARFATADSLDPGRLSTDFWRHPPGTHCFEFEAPPRR